MKVVRVQHVSVNCEGRLDETRDFYRDLLELPDAERPDFGVPGHWFAVGEAQLHLVDATALGEGIDPIGDHWCVEVTDLDAAREELDAKGIPYLESPGDVVQIWVTDPNGHVLELQQAP
jgi:catechol 2,3-dioxygenase-like lactoylglutathione lyase family enzyme